MPITVLTEMDLRGCVGLDKEAMAAVRRGFEGVGRGGVVMPPILRLDIAEANGEMDVKTAYVPGLAAFALKISTGFFDNPKKGLPSLSGMMTLISAETGQVEAVLLDNGYLTDVRTALAGAIAADTLARPDAKVAAIIGSGLQARLQFEALTLVRQIERGLIWGRSSEKARRCAEELSGKLGIAVETVERAEDAVRAADIVVTTTPARAPIVEADWLQQGTHVTAMGSDAEEKNELAPDCLARADLLVVDRLAQCERLGELHHALAAGMVTADKAVELGDILIGKAAGRTGADAVTVCDLTGTGVQDTAIALFAHRRCVDLGLGNRILT